MTVTPEIRWSLQIGSGVFWTLVYLFIIRRGFADQTYGMPLIAVVNKAKQVDIHNLLIKLLQPEDRIIGDQRSIVFNGNFAQIENS